MLSLCVSGSASASVRDSVEAELISDSRLQWFSEKNEQSHRNESAKLFRLRIDTSNAAVDSNHRCDDDDELYDCRFAWSDESTVGEVVQEVMSLLCRRQFLSTRGGTKCVISFLSVVRDGLAADGGLFTLCAVPRVALSQLKYICTAPQLSYLQTAQMVLERLIDTSLPPYVLRGQLREAYDPSHWGGLRDVCPLTPLAPRVPMEATLRAPTTDWQGVYVLELYHGPTAAFKDFALQLFPLYFDTAVNTMCTTLRDDASRKDEISGTTVASSPHYMIVTATSGDTGVAAISGFVNAHSPCSVMVLYPLRGVSPVQQMQMLSYDNGTSVRVIGVESDFDFCQRTVKDLFADNYLGRRLESELNVRLSSANSINWGRLIPQVVYYFWSYRKLVTQQGPSGGIAFGDKVDFVVPSGNFGNILAAYVAKLMGLPVGILVVASNNNDVLHEFVKTGVYDIRYRCVVPTASPSIDILKASNVERLLFFLSNGNTDYVRTRMEELEVEKRFEVSGEILQKMQETFWSSSCDEEQCAATIKEVFDTTGHLLDPHTAVAMHAAAQFHRAHVCTPQRPLVVVSTAHWAKFPTPVLRAVLGEELAQTPDSTATTGVAESCRTLYNRVLASCPGATVHPAIGNALAVFEAKLDTFAVRTVKADISVIRNELINLASSRAGNLYSVPDMAVVCSGNGVSVSPLWQHFMALDITKTFCATFASELAAVRDERQFAETLAALMSRWRRSNWDEIFLSPTTSTGDPNESGTRGIRKRYTVANVRGRSKDAVHNLNTGVEPAEQKKRDCAVATYYESIRVQRLMDDILFLSPEVVARWEAEEFQRYGCDGIMNLRRKWRRRCALLRAVDEIWRVSVDAGPDFLLPVTELEAPQYYRRIKQPVSVSSLYCGVWDSTVQDYAELKAQLTLMRTNCEEYNGVDSALVVNCRKIVKAGYNAARDAETYERQQETLEQGLVTPASLQKSGDGGMYGAVSLVGVVEDSTLMMPLPPDELRELFPPRREAASRDPEREGNRDDIFDDSDANRNDKKIRGNQNAAKRTLRQVLRLNPRTITAQAVGPAAGSASVDRPVPATTPLLDDDSARPRLRLRPLSLTPAKTTPGAGGDVDAAGTGGEEEGGLWKLTDHRGRERKTERSTRALPGDAEPPRRQESKRLKSVKGEKQSKRKRKRGKSGRDTDDSEEEAVVGVHREPKARREVRTRKEVRQAKNNKAGAVEACKVRRGGTSKVVESRKNRSSGKRRKFRGSSSSGSSSSSSSSSLASYTESLTDSDTQPVQKPSPSITVEELKLLEVAMDQLDAVPLQKQNIKELLSQIKRIEDKLGQYNDS